MAMLRLDHALSLSQALIVRISIGPPDASLRIVFMIQFPRAIVKNF